MATRRDVIVIGGSAGAVDALKQIVAGLPADFPAAIFAVIHLSPSSPGVMPMILDRAGPLKAMEARDYKPYEPGHIYLPPPDHHLLIKNGVMRVTRGPKENSFRPAVDPLFRTAARALGPRVIGVILSGGLDDGTAGCIEIKERGGITIAQDPLEATFPGMPLSAIDNAKVDHVLPVASIAATLTCLVQEPLPAGAPAMARKPTTDQRKPDAAEARTQTVEQASRLHDTRPSALTCPECGGALWESRNGKLLRYECHVGHGFSAESLGELKSDEIEQALWSAVRALEESASLKRRMARRAEQRNFGSFGEKYNEQAMEAEERAALLRALVTDERVRPPAGTRASAKGNGSSKRNGRRHGRAEARRGKKPRGNRARSSVGGKTRSA